MKRKVLKARLTCGHTTVLTPGEETRWRTRNEILVVCDTCRSGRHIKEVINP